MPSLQIVDDVAQVWGADIQLGPTGDLARANLSTRSQQRVLRRLMTNPSEYAAHPEYGGGLPSYVGSNIDAAGARTVIAGQMQLEDSVVQLPPPNVAVRPIENGLQAEVSYVVQPAEVPAVLSFSVTS